MCVYLCWDQNIDQYRWYLVIYPQCIWLLIIKLYHNELLQLIYILQAKQNFTNKYSVGNGKPLDNEKTSISCANLNKQLNIKILKYYKRLFLYQTAVWWASLHAAIFYAFCLVYSNYNQFFYLKKNNNKYWQLLDVWPLFLALMLLINLTISIKTSWNRKLEQL